MVAIIKQMQKYVPAHFTVQEQKLSTGETVQISNVKFHHIPVGGDQLTVARGRGAQGIRSNGDTPAVRLEGIHMYALDWHTKINFLGVSALFLKLQNLNHFVSPFCS